MSTHTLNGYSRAGLVGGILIDSYHGSQLQLSRAAEQAARREALIKEARTAAPRAKGMPRWTTWLLSGVRRSSPAPGNSSACVNC